MHGYCQLLFDKDFNLTVPNYFFGFSGYVVFDIWVNRNRFGLYKIKDLGRFNQINKLPHGKILDKELFRMLIMIILIESSVYSQIKRKWKLKNMENITSGDTTL